MLFDINQLANSNIDISGLLKDLPATIKMFEGLLEQGKKSLPLLVNFLNSKFEPAKGNHISTLLTVTNTKIFFFVCEFSVVNNKDTIVKTHYKGELIQTIEGLKKYLPENLNP